MLLFSFILPAYKAKFLKQAINSILSQDYENFELIVVDDCSPENLFEIVSDFSDSRVKYYRNEENIGGVSLVKQWNHSISFAKGEYLILAADDDLYADTFLSTILELINKYPEADLLRSRVELINENNELIGIDGVTPEFTSKYQYLYYWLNSSIITCIGNYVFKTSIIKEKQFIDFPFAFGSDTASTVNMSVNGVANTSEMLFKFRISSIHLSSNKGKLHEKLDANNQLFEWFKSLNYIEPNMPIDLYCFRHTRWSNFYQKYRFDCYNLVIRHLPLKELFIVNKCTLLSKKDKFVLVIRYLKDRFLRF